jgi:hypothetical protein
MEARYSSLVSSIRVEFNLSELPVEDRLNLLNSLLRDTGVIDSLYKAFDSKELDAAFSEAFKKFREENRGKK